MQIVVASSNAAGERRVGLVPHDVRRLVNAGHDVGVVSRAGTEAGFPDSEYEAAGAVIVDSVVDTALVVMVDAPARPIGAALLGFLDPLGEPERLATWAAAGQTIIALERVPRTTRAQSMDALTSQTTIIGYQAVVEAAALSPVLFPMLVTAAGTIRPATVLVLGVGVAGLQAIATAKRLGAMVYAYDIRPEAKEQVESLGARFVGGPLLEGITTGQGYAGEVTDDIRQAQQAALAERVASADVVITTAQVPGRRAPILLTAEMVASMRPGAVIVDTAASTGGNTAVTVPGETAEVDGVTIVGAVDLASRTATHASTMLSRNVSNLIDLFAGPDGSFVVDRTDDIVDAVVVAHGGEVTLEGAA